MKKFTVCMLETPPKDSNPIFIYTNTGRAIVFENWDQWQRQGEALLNSERAVGWWPAIKQIGARLAGMPPMFPIRK